MHRIILLFASRHNNNYTYRYTFYSILNRKILFCVLQTWTRLSSSGTFLCCGYRLPCRLSTRAGLPRVGLGVWLGVVRHNQQNHHNTHLQYSERSTWRQEENRRNKKLPDTLKAANTNPTTTSPKQAKKDFHFAGRCCGGGAFQKTTPA